MSNTEAGETKVSLFDKIARSVKGMRGEIKRVVWPSRKQVINNTGIVLTFMLLAAILIGGFDLLLSKLLSELLKLL